MLHETVHIVFDRVQEPEACDIWLAEGIAIYYAGQTDPAYVSGSDCPRIADMAGDESAFVENGGYDNAGIYVWYLIKQYGMEKLLSLYRGEGSLEELIDEGFERRAVAAYLDAR